jgi:hypothetical protein
MAVKLKRVVLWRKEVTNQPGVLANTLEPFAEQGADLQIVMGYRYPGEEGKAAIELYPIAGKKMTEAAQASGLSGSSIPVVLVEGDNKPGLGHAIAKSIGDANINLTFLVAQVIGRKYSAVIGFETEEDSKRAAALIKQATSKARR